MATVTIVKKKSTLDQPADKTSTQLPAITPNPYQKYSSSDVKRKKHRRILTEYLNEYINNQYLEELVLRESPKRQRVSPEKKYKIERSPEYIIEQARLSIYKRRLGIIIKEEERIKTPNSIIEVFKVNGKGTKSQSLKKLPRLSPSKYIDSYVATNKKSMHNYKIKKLNACTVELYAMCRYMQRNIDRKLRAIEYMDNIVD